MYLRTRTIYEKRWASMKSAGANSLRDNTRTLIKRLHSIGQDKKAVYGHPLEKVPVGTPRFRAQWIIKRMIPIKRRRDRLAEKYRKQRSRGAIIPSRK